MDIRSVAGSAQSTPLPVLAERNVSEASVARATVKPATSVDTVDAVQQPAQVPNLEQVNTAVKEINKTMQALSQDLEFSVDKDTDRTIVKVVDQKTGDVIRQMPTQEALDIAKALDKVQGLLIRQKA